VAFHVEIRRSVQRAWAFNLDPIRLRDSVLDPWLRGRVVELGGKEWDPRESSLRVLEGPELESAELAMGQGWHNAQRRGREVTRELFERAIAEEIAVAVLATTQRAEALALQLLEELGVRSASWPDLRQRVLSAAASDGSPGGPAVAAALLVADGVPDEAWTFDAGLAIGLLGGRAIVARLGEGKLPAALRGLPVISLDSGGSSPLRAVAARLRDLGLPIGEDENE